MNKLDALKLSHRIMCIMAPLLLVTTIVIVSILTMLAIPTWVNHNDVFKTELPQYLYMTVQFIVNYGAICTVISFIVIILYFLVYCSGKKREDSMP